MTNPKLIESIFLSWFGNFGFIFLLVQEVEAQPIKGQTNIQKIETKNSAVSLIGTHGRSVAIPFDTYTNSSGKSSKVVTGRITETKDRKGIKLPKLKKLCQSMGNFC